MELEVAFKMLNHQRSFRLLSNVAYLKRASCKTLPVGEGDPWVLKGRGCKHACLIL